MPRSPTDPFGSARRRLARAKVHVAEFERKMQTFFDRKPYRRVSHLHFNGINEIHKIKLRKLPASFSDIATGALENLRAALDYAAYVFAIQVTVKFDVGFEDAPILRGADIKNVFRYMTTKVERIIMSLEAESRHSRFFLDALI